MLGRTVYTAGTSPTIRWTVVATEPDKGLDCIESGILNRLKNGERILAADCIGMDIVSKAFPKAPGEYVSYTQSACFATMADGELVPLLLEAGEYLVEYRNGRQCATATFTVVEAPNE